ncbi:MAG: hypothetical protein ABJA79_10620 [Parafilimonas sp.]
MNSVITEITRNCFQLKKSNRVENSFKWFVICLAPLSCLSSLGQNNNIAANEGLKVFIDCPSLPCPFDYIRSEIKYIDYVNDRYACNVYVLITTSSTGGGGREYKLYFEGLENFASLKDTLSYIRTAVETDDEDRKKMVQSLKLGLIPFLAKTNLASRIQISVDQQPAEQKEAQTTPQKDKWNAWVFNIGLNGNFNGDDNYNSFNTRLRLTANRITEKLKLNFYSGYGITQDRYIYKLYNDTTGELIFSDTTLSKNTNSKISGTVAVSINDHWSAGLFSNYYSSSYDNIDGSFSVKPAIEYSIFPYKNFTTKYMGFLYRIGGVYNNYRDTTWRSKTTEWLMRQTLSFDLNFTQKWGSVSASLSWANYFFNWKWNNYGVYANGEFRIVKGLSFNFYGGASIIHDQVELQKGDATQTQVLIRQRLLRNSFSYFTGFGLSYRFGSIYNNIVNPRLGEANNGGFSFSY